MLFFIDTLGTLVPHWYFIPRLVICA